jgi:hypothetical protein
LDALAPLNLAAAIDFAQKDGAVGNDQITVATQQLIVFAVAAKFAGVEEQDALAVRFFEYHLHRRLKRLFQLQRLGCLQPLLHFGAEGSAEVIFYADIFHVDRDGALSSTQPLAEGEVEAQSNSIKFKKG